MHTEQHTELDNLITMQSNLRNSAKGSNDAYDVSTSLTETNMKEKSNSDNTSGALGRLSLGPSKAQDITGTINELTKVDPHEQELLYDTFEFFDDVTGQTLDKKMAVEARKLEMQFFRNMTVYDKVPRWTVARSLRRSGGTSTKGTSGTRTAEPGNSAGRSRRILDWTHLPPLLHRSPCE